MAVSRLKYPTFFNMSASKGGRASGGNKTVSGSYTIHTFTTANSLDYFIVNDATLQVDILIVGGGGCGGYWGGGGGAGGYVSATSITLSGGKTYSVMVGAGGTPSTYSATPTYYFGGPGQSSQFGNYIALGGGGAGSHISTTGITLNGRSVAAGGTYKTMHGGSGGGGGIGESGYCTNGGFALTDFAFSGTAQGNVGGYGWYRGEGGSSYPGGGGGGGAGAAGQQSQVNNGGNGGIGLSNSISGSAVYYSGGGGGGSRGGTQGLGGNGGGGAGSYTTTQNTGTANTGGGGGGNYYETTPSLINYSGANGGSGIIIVRYLT